MWLTYRVAYERLRNREGKGQSARVLIIGAGEAGNLLVREMMRFPTGYHPVGFVDDDPSMWGATMQGVEVIGGTCDLTPITEAVQAEEIIVAIPSAEPADLRRLVAQCENTRLPFKVLPGIAEVLAGHVHTNQLRELRIEDLLGREPVKLSLPELAADLNDCTVLITGAAGSIGSELARQVAWNTPARLLLLDQAESDLFYVDLDLRREHPELEIVSIVGDITDEVGMRVIFSRYAPDRVYHAAAYKHVPLMECNAREAVRNNVIGTWRLAELAGEFRAQKFVFVSTDKAVQPTSIMGATKRAAELVILELQDKYRATSYGAVRFGNVLGSNGSVIPIFRRQLEAGEPLTVTHPETTRYFMTISEAVQLVLQASLLAEFRGHIVMLDMGEPVRIMELAENLLRLSGRSASNGQIVITGLRPGEKIHEELVAIDEEAVPTAIEKIRVIRGRGPHPRIVHKVALWATWLADANEDGVLQGFSNFFPDIELNVSQNDVFNVAELARN